VYQIVPYENTERVKIMMSEIIALDSHRSHSIIETAGLTKIYGTGAPALSDVSLEVRSSDFISVIGSSGAGKSTFIRCINRLVQPTSGTIHFCGKDITNVNGREISLLRQKIGMIFQQFHLVKRLSVLENVLAGRLRFTRGVTGYTSSLFKHFPRTEKEKALDCLKQVGIADLAFQRADTLSGGQQQRVAIARALAQEPEVFLADEPIASLDMRSATTVMDILRDIHEKSGIPVIVNLHHLDYAKRYASRIIGMSSGKVVFDGRPSDLGRDEICAVYGNDPSEFMAMAYA
jgi:phosphonate transport system ATP-binding protein